MVSTRCHANSCFHGALRGAQKIINEGYIYVVDLDLERFFDTVSHSKLIEILGRTIQDGRMVSLIHKYHHLANMKRLLLVTDEWLRRRIRMYIWKAWKKATRKGYWRIADSYILYRAITNEHLCKAVYVTLMGSYLEWHPK